MLAASERAALDRTKRRHRYAGERAGGSMMELHLNEAEHHGYAGGQVPESAQGSG